VTTNLLGPFFFMRPFQPFVICVADERELRVEHPELTLAEGGVGIWYLYPTGEVEIVDVSLISSIRTLGPANLDHFIAR
jgi:hypothetical protein